MERTMPGRLTTHVLDTMTGRPGAGIEIELHRLDGEARHLLKRAVTNADGRCDAPLLAGDEMAAGVFELVFHLGAYFRGQAAGVGEPAFLDLVPIRFGIADPGQHYHVPLVATPFAYSTYRGS
jgi:5-hydroxyisourate hydrolase